MLETNQNLAGEFRLGFLIHDVSRLRRTVVDKIMKPQGITRSQWWVLTNLSRNSSNEMMQTELANVLDIGKVALSGLLDRLEASGFVERPPRKGRRRRRRLGFPHSKTIHSIVDSHSFDCRVPSRKRRCVLKPQELQLNP